MNLFFIIEDGQLFVDFTDRHNSAEAFQDTLAHGECVIGMLPFTAVEDLVAETQNRRFPEGAPHDKLKDVRRFFQHTSGTFVLGKLATAIARKTIEVTCSAKLKELGEGLREAEERLQKAEGALGELKAKNTELQEKLRVTKEKLGEWEVWLKKSLDSTPGEL